MEAAERSPNTVKTYLTALAPFLNWADGQWVEWRTVNVLDLTRYKRYLLEAAEPHRSAEVNGHCRAVAHGRRRVPALLRRAAEPDDE